MAGRIARIGKFERSQHELPTGAMLDIIQGNLYDSVQMAAGTYTYHTYHLFSIPIGQQGKTFIDTNMERCGSLPQPNQFLAKRIIVTIPTKYVPEDISNLLENTVMTFWLCDKHYGRVTLIQMPVGAASMDISPIRQCLYCSSCYVDLKCPHCGATEFTIFQKKDPGSELVFSNAIQLVSELGGPEGIMIPPEWSFNIKLEIVNQFTLLSSPKGKGLKFWVRLDGLMMRSVQ